MNIVDELGQILQQKAELEAREKAIKAELAADGRTSIAGEHFTAVITRANRTNVTWKDVAEHLAIPAETLAMFSKTQTVTSVSVREKV